MTGLHVIIDARIYDLYPPLSSKMTAGTELLLRHFARAMAEAGHRVDVIVAEKEEQYLDGAYWWTPRSFPKTCDVLISCEILNFIDQFKFKRLLVPLNRIDPSLVGREEQVAAFVALSETHRDYLLDLNPTIRREQVRVIGPGVDIPPPIPKEDFSVLYCNAPGRGLVHLAHTWADVMQRVPGAKLHLTYDVQRDIDTHRWKHNQQGHDILDVMAWLREAPERVVNHGGLSRDEVLALQQRTEVYAYPCDPPGVGTCVHCLAAMEAAAAGNLLLLSDCEGLPEVFGEIGIFASYPIREVEWPDALEEILKDRELVRKKGDEGRAWAAQFPWSQHHKAWQELVTEVMDARN